jgi:hypothetical protein
VKASEEVDLSFARVGLSGQFSFIWWGAKPKAPEKRAVKEEVKPAKSPVAAAPEATKK